MPDLIAAALASSTDTRAVVVEAGAVRRTGEVLIAAFGDRTAIPVADERTFAVVGAQVVRSLEAAGVQVLPAYLFPGDPELYAQYGNCEVLRDSLRDVPGVVVAIGAGTLNDLVKRACGELGRPYLVVCTAASMDGYTAFGASISREGYKQTMDCAGPRACVADLDVMAAAPPDLTASGFGDLLGKITAGADWILADALAVEPLDDRVWSLVQGPLRQAVGRPEALARGDGDAVGALARGLLMSGLAMQAHASSRPASGAEHQFSHLWEMEGLGVDVTPRRLSHGSKVGIGTVAVAALYERLLARDVARLDIDAAVAAWQPADAVEARVRSLHPGGGPVDEIAGQAMAKYVSPAELRARLERLAEAWPQLRSRLREQLLGPRRLQELLDAVGAPSHPASVGLDRERFRDTYVRAQTIRRRYTVLDVVLEAGLLDELVAELFDPTGFWGGDWPEPGDRPEPGVER